MPTSKRCLTKNGLSGHGRVLPVVVITGFSGSGKTTLLNHILNNAQGLKVAVLVNEFSDINIDAPNIDAPNINAQYSILSEQSAVDAQMVALSNGCFCCTINESLTETISQVLAQASAQKVQIDYLVVKILFGLLSARRKRGNFIFLKQ